MGSKAPPPPDYTAAAQAQGAANLQSGITQSYLNNPNVNTPFGSSSWVSGGTDANGNPLRPTENQTLSPAEQAALDQRNTIRTDALGTLINDMPNISAALTGPFGLSGSPMVGWDSRYAPAPGGIQTNAGLGAAGPIQTGLNYAGAPAMPVADDATRQAVANAVYQQGAQYLDPQFNQAQDALTTNLANQGITQGSTAADRAQGNFNLAKQQAYGNLIDQSTQSGIGAMNTLFNEQLGARQQGVGETTTQGQFTNAAHQQAVNDLLSSMSARNAGVVDQGNLASAATAAFNQGRGQQYQEYAANRTMPINMLSGVLSQGQINAPQFQATTPTSITPAPILQGAYYQGMNNAANASANAGILGSALGAFGSMGAAALMPAPSDRRLKGNIRRIGRTRQGLNIYSYTIFGEPQIGVMADEVERIIPAAVSIGQSGFKQVDYSMLEL